MSKQRQVERLRGVLGGALAAAALALAGCGEGQTTDAPTTAVTGDWAEVNIGGVSVPHHVGWTEVVDVFTGPLWQRTFVGNPASPLEAVQAISGVEPVPPTELAASFIDDLRRTSIGVVASPPQEREDGSVYQTATVQRPLSGTVHLWAVPARGGTVLVLAAGDLLTAESVDKLSTIVAVPEGERQAAASPDPRTPEGWQSHSLAGVTVSFPPHFHEAIDDNKETRWPAQWATIDDGGKPGSRLFFNPLASNKSVEEAAKAEVELLRRHLGADLSAERVESLPDAALPTYLVTGRVTDQPFDHFYVWFVEVDGRVAALKLATRGAAEPELLVTLPGTMRAS